VVHLDGTTCSDCGVANHDMPWWARRVLNTIQGNQGDGEQASSRFLHNVHGGSSVLRKTSPSAVEMPRSHAHDTVDSRRVVAASAYGRCLASGRGALLPHFPQRRLLQRDDGRRDIRANGSSSSSRTAPSPAASLSRPRVDGHCAALGLHGSARIHWQTLPPQSTPH
jgi:hypothetical protein